MRDFFITNLFVILIMSEAHSYTFYAKNQGGI